MIIGSIRSGFVFSLSAFLLSTTAFCGPAAAEGMEARSDDEDGGDSTLSPAETIVVTGRTATSVATKADIPILVAPQAISVFLQSVEFCALEVVEQAA